MALQQFHLDSDYATNRSRLITRVIGGGEADRRPG